MSVYSVTATRRFLRGAKKLHPNTAEATHQAILKIAENPFVGDRKKADLADFYVVKFQALDVEYLIAYSIDELNLKVQLAAIGAHENFYRNLKRN
ncbi:MAG: type II toxin-antitoxin system RelE/ParE family toxin [Actinobacteria bacterium]|nr:type II toxin-antitoxin system RelE/ParE family toxin [Actinomycetota bacterium]